MEVAWDEPFLGRSSSHSSMGVIWWMWGRHCRTGISEEKNTAVIGKEQSTMKEGNDLSVGRFRDRERTLRDNS